MGERRIRLSGWTSRPDGTRLRHQVDGVAGAPALLLLPGQANSHHWWDRLRGDLADRFLTVTFDYRGTGETEAAEVDDDAEVVDGPWSTAGFADDAAAVLAALGRERCAVYGTSMGGRVAQELTLRHPALVERLVLAGTSPGGPHAVELDREVRRMLGTRDAALRLAHTVELFYTPAWVAAHGGVTGVPRDLFGDPAMTRADGRRHLRVSGRHDAYDRLPAIGVPTLVLHGTDDRMVPVVNARTLADRVPDAVLHLVAGGRHGFFDEHRPEVVPVLRDFLLA